MQKEKKNMETQIFAERKKKTISLAHREAISRTLREGYRTGRYDKPVGNTLNHCTGPRPHVWKHGPDPVVKAQNMAMLRSKAQAVFRGEVWKLSLDDYRSLWKGNWHRRGRHTEALWMCRKDNTRPWSRSNCYIGTRAQHFKHVYKNYKGIKYITKEK